MTTAKNYLDGDEINTMSRIVVMFLDQAEFRAMRRQDILMRDWAVFLDKFLRDTALPVLEGAGSVSHEDARAWAETQYGDFAVQRRVAAEGTAEVRYLDDLRESAKTLEGLHKPGNSRHKPAPRRDKES